MFAMPHIANVAKMFKADLQDARRAWLDAAQGPEERLQREVAKAGPQGFEPQLTDPESDNTGENPEENGDSGPAGPVAGPVKTKTCSPDADLQAVINAWPELPDAIRAGIVAIVRAANSTTSAHVE